MANNPRAPPRAGLSLYANLLDPKNAAPGTISSAPVSYTTQLENSPEKDEAVKKQQALAASLRFQPTKRPQIASQKAKAKAIASKFAPPVTATVTTTTTQSKSAEDGATTTATPQSFAPRTTAADWTATASDDEDVSNFYTVKRERGGRKKRKKNKEVVEVGQNWDDIYDPSRPNNYEEYKHSEEKIREVREWKDLLYRHRMRRRTSSGSEDEDQYRPVNRQFAPPASFAPPPDLNDESSQQQPPPPPPVAQIPDDPTGEDAYLRRLRLTQGGQAQPSPDPLPVANPAPGQISRAPIRYNLPVASEEIPSTEAEAEERFAESETTTQDGTEESRSSRPGQAGFAERLMSKYGWSKGQGLGAQGTGIINPLYAKVDKRKKKSDAEGGGYATPAGTGKILGGNKSKAALVEEEGRFGAMSEVIRLEGMLNGLDLEEELVQGEGGIMQEIGEECGEKYGSVERVYIHAPEKDDEEALVFVHFVSQLSALRAVNALEGRIFNGNPIKARFWPKERFDARDYV